MLTYEVFLSGASGDSAGAITRTGNTADSSGYRSDKAAIGDTGSNMAVLLSRQVYTHFK